MQLHTADGLTLVGELALPLHRDPVATLLTLHPLPTHGGFMDSHVFKKAAYRLPALADLAVLRFNLRGVTSPRGTSQGTFGEGVSEQYDVAAAIELAEFHEGPELPHRWLVGWSFGTDLTLMYGLDPSVEGAILLSPPLRYSGPEHLAAWADSGKPLVALVPEHDDYLQPPQARERFAAVPQAEVVGVDGAKHLWVGALRASGARRDRGPGQPRRLAPGDDVAGRRPGARAEPDSALSTDPALLPGLTSSCDELSPRQSRRCSAAPPRPARGTARSWRRPRR